MDILVTNKTLVTEKSWVKCGWNALHPRMEAAKTQSNSFGDVHRIAIIKVKPSTIKEKKSLSG